MKRNDTYLSPGLSSPPASFDYDSGDDCQECGFFPCICDDEDTMEALLEDYDDFRKDGIEEGYDGILGEG